MVLNYMKALIDLGYGRVPKYETVGQSDKRKDNGHWTRNSVGNIVGNIVRANYGTLRTCPVQALSFLHNRLMSAKLAVSSASTAIEQHPDFRP